MFGIADYSAFVAAIILFLLIPGPGNLALITSTSKGGILGGLAATLGVILGDQVLMWSAVAGVAALLAACFSLPGGVLRAFGGVLSDKYGAHSFRRGGATLAADMGASVEQLKALGDWRSDAYQAYINPDTDLHKLSTKMVRR